MCIGKSSSSTTDGVASDGALGGDMPMTIDAAGLGLRLTRGLSTLGGGKGAGEKAEKT